MYWDIFQILPYQRHFNLINGPREIGKTYTTLKWLIKQALTKNKQFAYICRTQDEKKHDVLKHALEKVCAEQYPEYELKGNNFICKLDNKPIAYCIALSEYIKIKKYSFPDVHYFIFDEYMLESSDTSMYVKGWKEPDLLLSIYQTIDRGRDSLIGFMMGNNTNFFNPYHLHPAFNIPFVQPGKIWTSSNVLFQRALPSKELTQQLSQNKFNQQIAGTEYANYALSGTYENEKDVFITKLTNYSKYQFTALMYDFKFGIYSDMKQGCAIISDSIDITCPFIYALTLEDHKENTLLSTKNNVQLKWLSSLYKKGCVRFTSLKVKSQATDFIRMIV